MFNLWPCPGFGPAQGSPLNCLALLHAVETNNYLTTLTTWQVTERLIAPYTHDHFGHPPLTAGGLESNRGIPIESLVILLTTVVPFNILLDKPKTLVCLSYASSDVSCLFRLDPRVSSNSATSRTVRSRPMKAWLVGIVDYLLHDSMLWQLNNKT